MSHLLQEVAAYIISGALLGFGAWMWKIDRSIGKLLSKHDAHEEFRLNANKRLDIHGKKLDDIGNRVTTLEATKQ